MSRRDNSQLVDVLEQLENNVSQLRGLNPHYHGDMNPNFGEGDINEREMYNNVSISLLLTIYNIDTG